jgi:hypothetical protein
MLKLWLVCSCWQQGHSTHRRRPRLPPLRRLTPGDDDRHKHEPSKQEITMAQQTLSKAGLYKGKVDGKWNNDLSAAVKKYQTENKLKATGKLDEETLHKMQPPAPATAPASP